jgi:hypothetical protein
MTENQIKLLTLLQKVDLNLANEFEKLVLANELSIISDEILATKTAEISTQAGAIINPVIVEPEPITPITESKVLELINERVGLVGIFPNMIVSIDGLEIAKFDFQDVTEEFFINFLNKYGI